MKRILVTGATGFLGRHLCRHLLSHGYRVRGLGRNLVALGQLKGEGVEAVVGDFCQPFWAARAVEGCEAVVHAGALSSPWGSPRQFESANVEPTADLLKVCPSGLRFVFISTPSLYAESRDRWNIRESDPLPKRFINDYARSKSLAETLVNRAINLETVILRPQAIFGPGDTSLLPRFREAALRGGIPELKPGGPLVDVTNVENACHAIRRALEVGREGIGQTFHISDGEPIQLIPFLKEVFQRLNLPFRSRVMPAGLLENLASLSEVVYRGLRLKREPRLTRYTATVLRYDRTLDLDHARTSLGYTPVISREEGLRRYADHRL